MSNRITNPNDPYFKMLTERTRREEKMQAIVDAFHKETAEVRHLVAEADRLDWTNEELNEKIEKVLDASNLVV